MEREDAKKRARIIKRMEHVKWKKSKGNSVWSMVKKTC